jgi:uncharacterized damage-inducible protein DinB
MSEVARILDQLDRGFAGEAWHGPALQELLDGVSAEDASRHPVSGAHSVWELVNHIAAWNLIVRHRVAGETVEVTPEMDWPPVWEISEVAWTRALDHLKESRDLLRGTIQQLRDEQLNQQVLGEKYSIYVMLHGLVQHDLYHAGQIAILKKGVIMKKEARA